MLRGWVDANWAPSPVFGTQGGAIPRPAPNTPHLQAWTVSVPQEQLKRQLRGSKASQKLHEEKALSLWCWQRKTFLRPLKETQIPHQLSITLESRALLILSPPGPICTPYAANKQPGAPAEVLCVFEDNPELDSLLVQVSCESSKLECSGPLFPLFTQQPGTKAQGKHWFMYCLGDLIQKVQF